MRLCKIALSSRILTFKIPYRKVILMMSWIWVVTKRLLRKKKKLRNKNNLHNLDKLLLSLEVILAKRIPQLRKPLLNHLLRSQPRRAVPKKVLKARRNQRKLRLTSHGSSICLNLCPRIEVSYPPDS